MGLEDALGDVVGKAMRGNKVSAETLADKTGLTAGQVQQMLAYKYTPPDDEIATIARVLELNYRGLVRIAHDSYSPTAPGLDKWPNLAAWSSNYDNFSVNAFMAWDTEAKEAVLFDTGTDMNAIKRIVDDNGLLITVLALTHTHGDHVQVLNEVREEFGPRIVGSAKEPVAGAEYVTDGQTLKIGLLDVVARETDGHSLGGLTFVISGSGSAPDLAVVGDAIFAGSAGGAAISYENLHRNIRGKILSLPNETLLLPGHGPITTVGQEKINNPFAPVTD